MGNSDKLPDSGPGRYRFVEHRRFLDLTANAAWIAQSPVPKLFVNGDPGALLTGPL